MTRWITTYACDAARCVVPAGREVTTGVPVVTGREGEIGSAPTPRTPGSRAGPPS